MTTTNPFSAMTDDTFTAAMVPAMASVETLRLWAEESQRRQEILRQQVTAGETSRLAARPSGKPGVTRNGVPCTLWYGKKTDKNPTGEKTQVDRHCVVLTLPASVSTVNETTKNGKTSSTTATVSYGPAVIMWLRQDVTVGKSGIPVLSPSGNAWYPSGSSQTEHPEQSEAMKAIELVSDLHDCWIQETNHSELTPATARQVKPAEFKKIAVQTILGWHKTHGKA